MCGCKILCLVVENNTLVVASRRYVVVSQNVEVHGLLGSSLVLFELGLPDQSGPGHSRPLEKQGTRKNHL